MSKVVKIIDAIYRIVRIICSIFTKNDKKETSKVDISQDSSTNLSTLKRVNDIIKIKTASIIAVQMLLCGCFNFNFGTTDVDSKNEDARVDSREIILANPLNVYRTSTNVVIKAMIQNRRKKWVESDKDVLIPGGWYIVSGTELEEN